MKKLIENDRLLKVVSVVIALIIWLYIIIILDPDMEVAVRDIPIQIIGEEQLAERGLSIVNESATEVSFQLKGSRKRMGNNNMKSIIAKADVSEITQTGTTSVPVEVVVPFENHGIDSQNPYNLDVHVERLVSKTFPVKIKTTGSLAENYMAGPMEVDVKEITVSGPESVVGNLTSAGVVLDYEAADVDIDKSVPIRLYGSGEKEIGVNDVTMRRIKQDKTETMIHCKVVRLRTVSVIADIIHGGHDDESLNYTVEPKEVQIYGDEVLTAKITELKTEPIPIEKLLNNGKVKAKLMIPKGVKVLEDIGEAEIVLKE